MKGENDTFMTDILNDLFISNDYVDTLQKACRKMRFPLDLGGNVNMLPFCGWSSKIFV